MVSFRSLLVSTVALAIPISAILTPAQIVDSINILRAKGQALQAPAQSITIVNAPLLAVGLGPLPKIIVGFTDIVTTTTDIIEQMKGTPSAPAGPLSDDIFEAFREFVRVHQALLKILIDKAGLLSTIPIIGEPVANVLRQFENVVDTLSFNLITIVQSRGSDLQSEANSLSSSTDMAINSYNGIL